MINQELLFYIKEQLRAGATKEMLKDTLIGAGWNLNDVDEALKFVVPPPEKEVVVQREVPKSVGLENKVSIAPTKPQPVSSLNLNVYAPTQANSTPYFVGMPGEGNRIVSKVEPNQKTIQKEMYRAPVSPRKKGFGRSLLLGILFAGVIAGGMYFYRFYINPTDDYILKSAYTNFLSLESLTYDTEINTEVEYSFEASNIFDTLGIIVPPDTEDSANIPILASISGAFSDISKGVSSSLGFSIKTKDESPMNVNFTGDAILNKDTLYLKATEVDGSEYLSNFFDIERQTWFSYGIRESVEDKEATFLGSFFHTILSSRLLVEDFLKNDVITITSKLPEAVIDDMEMVRYQFSFNSEKALEAISKEPSAVRSMLSNIEIMDGEIFVSRKELLPKKVSFTVRPKNQILGAENISFKVATTITGVNIPIESKPIPSAVSFKDQHTALLNSFNDTQVKNTLATARAIADIYYSKKKSYLGFCKSSTDTGAASLIGPLEGFTGVGTVVCADTKKTFVLAAPLSDGMYFCVDNIASALAREKVPTLSCVGE